MLCCAQRINLVPPYLYSLLPLSFDPLIKMPLQRVKDCVKDFVKDLGEVFAVRLKRPPKNGPRQCSSTATNHDDGGSIHGQNPSAFPFPLPTLSSDSSPVHSASSREPGFESSTNVPAVRHSGGLSLACEASDIVQLALPLVQAVASGIPLVGAPMQAAIGGLLTGLQAIDVRACITPSTLLSCTQVSDTFCECTPTEKYLLIYASQR
ncbi:hypothetical protein BDR07DRAFT_411558 [Suillus spraguei]|nr:hypothetical protein BDR07DRAFT_411558 [Suillus spraguei]